MCPFFLFQVFTLEFPSPSLATVDRRVSMAHSLSPVAPRHHLLQRACVHVLRYRSQQLLELQPQADPLLSTQGFVEELAHKMS